MVYRALVAGRVWFPSAIEGESIVLRRHAPENLQAFRRWYADPEIARLARYQEGPMRVDEIDRFFQVRALGPESLAMAIHVRDSDRLIGTCAFSQLDADNGSALYHITVGEADAWGHGYGTEATRLMVAHAFGVLNLHRIALSVFEFNVRAIRSYAACGFVTEGRAREAIRRDGRWWDEVAMSILDEDWRRHRAAQGDRDAIVGRAIVGEAGRGEAKRAEGVARAEPVDEALHRRLATRILGR